jgi:hypothetical protein
MGTTDWHQCVQFVQQIHTVSMTLGMIARCTPHPHLDPGFVSLVMDPILMGPVKATILFWLNLITRVVMLQGMLT